MQLIRHSENKGTLEARRSGSLVAAGDYVLYVDPDDRIASGSLEKLSHSLEKNPVDILCYGHRGFGMDRGRDVKWNRKYSSGYLNVCSKQQMFDAVFGINPKMPWSLCVCAWRKGLVIDALNEMPRGYCIVGEDGCMFFMFCARAKKVDVIDSVVYEYRMDSGITSAARTLEWNSIERQLRSVSYIVRCAPTVGDEASVVYWKMFQRRIVEGVKDKVLAKLKNYERGIDLLEDGGFNDDMVGSLYLILSANERGWRRRMKLLKPFWFVRFFVSAARSLMGFRQRMSKSIASKVHYKNLHDDCKVMTRCLSSKG